MTQNTRIIIEAENPTFPLNFRAIWEHRELLAFMIWREWSVRYKQTALGIFWVILQPIATTIIFSLIFGLFVRAGSDGFPYPVYFLSGFVPWKHFMDSVRGASISLVSNVQLVDKVYFPRLILPFAAIIVTLGDFVALLVVLLVTIVSFDLTFLRPELLLMPFFLLMSVATATGVGLWFAAMNVKYRDVGQFLPFLFQLWMYATPIMYSAADAQRALSAPLWALYRLNPMYSIVQGFRWALVGADAPEIQFVASSVVIILVLLFSGLLYFSRMERTFGDII